MRDATMLDWVAAWMRSPRRMWRIWVRGVCPDCGQKMGWGQWNDGALAGVPFCFNAQCTKSPNAALSGKPAASSGPQ